MYVAQNGNCKRKAKDKDRTSHTQKIHQEVYNVANILLFFWLLSKLDREEMVGKASKRMMKKKEKKKVVLSDDEESDIVTVIDTGMDTVKVILAST